MSDVKQAYAAAVQLTLGLDVTPLASSATFVAGRESTAVVNTSNLYLDYLVGGFITVGTTPTTNTQIEIWVYASYDDVPSYPDVLDGTDSDEEFTNVEMKQSGLVLAHVIGIVSTTSNLAYDIAPFSVAALFGGRVPKQWGLFVTHNTGVALHTTAANHKLYYVPVYATVG